ncbi:MAG: hypothetical protein ABI867_22060 [Kofleriaceae bacterium]
MCIDVGLSRFYAADDANWPKALEALVASKLTKLVRDVIPGPTPKRGKAPLRVYEAKQTGKQVVGRWLDAKEAKPLLVEWAAVEKVGGSASWSFDDFEALHVDCQQLELIYDKPRVLAPNPVTLPGQRLPVKCDDLAHTTRQWQDWDREAAIVCMMHDIATRHRLIMHCA